VSPQRRRNRSPRPGPAHNPNPEASGPDLTGAACRQNDSSGHREELQPLREAANRAASSAMTAEGSGTIRSRIKNLLRSPSIKLRRRRSGGAARQQEELSGKVGGGSAYVHTHYRYIHMSLYTRISIYTYIYLHTHVDMSI